MSAGRRRLSIAGDAMNSLRWREDAKKTTRAWSSSALRMSATTAMAATTVIRRTTMTPSSRVVSTRCSTCRAGWRRSASSSPAISTPAADHPAGETVAVVANRGPTPHRAAAHRTGRLATLAAAAAQAAINADGNRQNPGSLITIDLACTKHSTPDAEEPVGGTRRSRCILRLTSDARFVHEHPVAESAGDEHAAAGEAVFTKNTTSCRPDRRMSVLSKFLGRHPSAGSSPALRAWRKKCVPEAQASSTAISLQ